MENRNISLLTISSHSGKLNEHEENKFIENEGEPAFKFN